MSTKVATKKETGVSMMMDDLFESAGQGMETMSSEDMQIPFLRICQALSPQLVKTDPKFIKGASAGDMFNNVTQQLWEGEEGLKIIPCAYEMKYLEFQLRESGGGFLGELDKNSPDIRQAQRTGSNEILPNGNELVRSAQYLVIAVDDDGVTQQMVLDMKKTQMKVAKQWNPRRAGIKIQHPTRGLFTPPMWATVWHLTTVSESNDRGTWYNYAIAQSDVESVPQAAVLEAKGLYEQFRRGEIKTSAAPSEEMPANQESNADDIPF